MWTAKTLIRVGGFPGWSESSLGAHAILLVLSWGDSKGQFVNTAPPVPSKLPGNPSVPIGVKVPSTSSLSVYTKVLAHNLNDIRNWASLIGLLLRICWCLLSVFLIYCSDEWKKLVNLIYCFQVLFRMNFKIMYFLMKILGNTPSADSAASRDSLSSQNATWGFFFFSSFYWWHIEHKGWMCERLLNLQEIYVSGQNICIEVYGNSVGTITPITSHSGTRRSFKKDVEV